MPLIPAVMVDGLVQPIVAPKSRDRHSCIWNQTPDGEPFAGEVVSAFVSSHSFGHPLMFKPTIAEVEACAPRGVDDGYFTISCEMTGPEAARMGRHVAVVTVWRVK